MVMSYTVIARGYAIELKAVSVSTSCATTRESSGCFDSEFEILARWAAGVSNGLFQMQLVDGTETSTNEHIERQRPARFIGFVRLHGVRQIRREDADVMGLRPISPHLAVVDIGRDHFGI